MVEERYYRNIGNEDAEYPATGIRQEPKEQRKQKERESDKELEQRAAALGVTVEWLQCKMPVFPQQQPLTRSVMSVVTV